MSIREIYNRFVGKPEGGGIKEARDSENNIIISDYTLLSLFLPQQKKMSK